MSKLLLKLAGWLGLLLALLQVALGPSPDLSRYWGAGEELVSNPLLLLGASLIVAGLFALGGLYALAGAGVLPRPPLLRLGLLAAGAVYTLRGLAFIPLLLVWLGVRDAPGPIPITAYQSSAVALAVGLMYLTGTLASWRRLSRAARPPRTGPSPAGNRPGPITS